MPEEEVIKIYEEYGETYIPEVDTWKLSKDFLFDGKHHKFYDAFVPAQKVKIDPTPGKMHTFHKHKWQDPKTTKLKNKGRK